MMPLIENWGAEDLFRKLDYLFEVRLVASEYIANFLTGFAGTVASLRIKLQTDTINL